MAAITFSEAATLKAYVWEHFKVVLHIHDACFGMYFTIEEENEKLKQFIIAYFKERGIEVTVTSDQKSFFI